MPFIIIDSYNLINHSIIQQRKSITICHLLYLLYTQFIHSSSIVSFIYPQHSFMT
jgi:hypothetical protein